MGMKKGLRIKSLMNSEVFFSLIAVALFTLMLVMRSFAGT